METALVLTIVLLPLTLGLVQYGVVLNATQSLSYIVRDAGRFAAMNGTAAGSDTAIRAHVRKIATQTTIRAADLPDNTIIVNMPDNNPRSSGNVIRVTINYPMAKKIFLGTSVSWMPGIDKLAQTYRVSSTYVLE